MKNINLEIGEKIRNLRISRRVPQRRLAEVLQVSQPTVSRLEAGRETLTIEQLLDLCRFFNVPPSFFLPEEGPASSQLRRSLIRHGAAHLTDDEKSLPSERLSNVKDVIRETLIATGSPRDIAALAPVIVQNAAVLPFADLEAELYRLGPHLHRRLCWLLENILEALKTENSPSLPPSRRVQYLRAQTRLSSEFHSLKSRWNPMYGQAQHLPEDILDANIASLPAIQNATHERSEISSRWKIVTRIKVDDFARALREARE